MWVPPKQFDEYRLLSPLGRGAMGHVYIAHDEFLDRHVAIKFVGTTNDEHGAARLRTEARAIARLQHPNVVTVYRVGTVLDQPYIVSELVRGRALDTLEVPVEEKLGLRVAVDLARGLAAAHRHGVLHRDIKPSNAILGEDGITKLLDFGLAKLTLAELPAPPPPTRSKRETGLDELSVDSTIDLGDTARPSRLAKPPQWSTSAEVTAVDGILGTPLYLAPECWLLEPASVASDIYSLGAVLYYLFSGQPPHQAETIALLGMRVTNEPAPDLASVARVDREIAAVIMHALAREADARFGSADELCEALERIAGKPRSAPLSAVIRIAACCRSMASTVGCFLAATSKSATSSSGFATNHLCSSPVIQVSASRRCVAPV